MNIPISMPGMGDADGWFVGYTVGWFDGYDACDYYGDNIVFQVAFYL